MATHIHWYVTVAYFLWFALGLLRYLLGADGGWRPSTCSA